jgi:hypothetical protein
MHAVALMSLLIVMPSWAQEELPPGGDMLAEPVEPVIESTEDSDESLDDADSVAAVASEDATISDEVEDLKSAALELNRDLLILEEELLFPANTQVVLFMSVDLGYFFRLDAVKVKIDGELVASHLYTERQNDALNRGGIQRLYLGNVKSGDHEITAIFTGIGPDKREYKRGATTRINKEDDPIMLEIRVRDSTARMQPQFEFEEWQL